MRTSQHLLSAILIVSLLIPGLPLFSPEDANRDSRVNLEDVILHVKDFARAADTPKTFTSNVKKVLSTLTVVAGLKAHIRPARDPKSSNTPISLDLAYLIPSANFSMPSNASSELIEKPFIYESVVLTPISPPPRAV